MRNGIKGGREGKVEDVDGLFRGYSGIRTRSEHAEVVHYHP